MLADAHAGRDGGRGADAPVRYLNCPRCRLSIRPRALSLQHVHCPRCAARTNTLVELFASPLPAERLYGGEGARDR